MPMEINGLRSRSPFLRGHCRTATDDGYFKGPLVAGHSGLVLYDEPARRGPSVSFDGHEVDSVIPIRNDK